jgi:hypothetical protein
MTPPTIATHRAPDADALCAAWLASRFLFAQQNAQVVFVARSWRPRITGQFSCVVDVGRAHDATQLLFDHKPPAPPDRNAECATTLVWKHLRERGEPISPLQVLVRGVHEGDRRPPLKPSLWLARSRKCGLHRLISRGRAEGRSDEQVLAVAFAWLDGYWFGGTE